MFMKAVNSYMVCRQHLATMAISTCNRNTAVNGRCKLDQAKFASAVQVQGHDAVHDTFPMTVLPSSMCNVTL
jgi:hypothetical protein